MERKLNSLAREMSELESETFEIADYTDADDLFVSACSTSSTSSTTSSTCA
ncbi:thiazolylpeptide-type bacteriocin [Nocardioides insulae]|uniref:thiazolylpeptide-type bacteriocin n=1 Tax=Nocardioides insulae TaxID=394734 RepID=UPI0003FCC29D|nr:thiazolylpeptide-type bacteriocin [Nocardioides insulae]